MHPTAPFKANGEIVYLHAIEIQLLRLICTDRSYRQIAKIMKRSPRSIDHFRDELFDKLGTNTRTGLILWTFKSGLMQVKDIDLTIKTNRKKRVYAKKQKQKNKNPAH